MRFGSNRKNTRTAAILLLLLCFISAVACLAFTYGVAHLSGAAQAFACMQAGKTGRAALSASGATALVAAKANMSTGEWVAVVAIVTVGALAFLALLLFMLVFPLINRIAGTHIPCFDLFSSEKEPSEKKSDTRERTTKVAEKSAGYADDRYVKTVRIDTLYHPEEEREITASSIDRAVRQASREHKEKKKK